MPATKEQCAKYRQTLRERVRAKVGCTCVVCGTDRKIEYAHIKPTKVNGVGRGMTRRYIDILRHPLYYVAMCRYHHVRFDACEFELVLKLFIWGRHVVIYDPSRRPSNRRKRRSGNPNSKAIVITGNCPF